MKCSAGRVAMLITVILIAGACAGTRVPYVQYRLRGHVAGPVAHGSVTDMRTTFAEVFCGTLRHMVADANETWEDCKTYIDVEGAVTPAPLSVLKPVQVFVVAGVFSQCLEKGGVKAFLDAKKHLEDARYHSGVKVEHVPVAALGTSSHNAREIRNFVTAHPGRYIAVGYSKGAADWMEAIAAYPEIRREMVGLVTVAGAVGGSRLPDLFGNDMVDWAERTLRKTGLKDCDVADGGGLTSLTRPNRQQFLTNKYDITWVPTYSVVAVAQDDDPSTPAIDERTISKALRILWNKLRVYSLDQDSQVIADDGIVPGGTFLAIARTDHWGVALPFAETIDAEERERALRQVDRNTYPRTALLEAILRIVNP